LLEESRVVQSRIVSALLLGHLQNYLDRAQWQYYKSSSREEDFISIPREALPGSLALDNFLLPGNKEDGADKSRHWNVFGGICLYKSPQEALDLALKREMQDLRDDEYSADAMREFFRELIAEVNGMYQVMAVDPDLSRRPRS
jgi:hypothetical protein